MSVSNVGYISVSPVTYHADVREQVVRQPEQATVKPQVIHSTTEDIKRMSLALSKKLQFVVDHGSNQVIVKVIDRETDKVIKELPPEELQRLHRNLKEAIGLVLDEMV